MNPEEFLAHSDFIHRLAHRLVSDENRAADITQQTWLAAMLHPSVGKRALPSWLARVATNFARRFHQLERRCSDREEVFAAPEKTLSTVEIVERAEVRHRLVEAVFDLHEPYRSTILLRFYENLPPREIAKKYRLPVETVKTRLKRGLSKIRDSLDASHGNDRKNWLSALVPLAGLKIPTASAGAGSLLSGFAGAAAMSMKVKMGIALLIVLGITLGLVRLVSDLPPDPLETVKIDYSTEGEPAKVSLSQDKDDLSLNVSGSDNPQRVPIPPTGSPVPETAAPGKTGSIEGTVYGVYGLPEARAPVIAMRIKDQGMSFGEKQETIADHRGRYAFKDLVPGEYRVRLASQGMGFPPAMDHLYQRLLLLDKNWRSSTCVKVEQGKVSAYDLREPRKSVIEGTVTEAGYPKEGLRIVLSRKTGSPLFRLNSRSTETDSRGAYRFDGLEPDRYRLKLDVKGIHPPLEEMVQLASGAKERRDFALSSCRVSGRVYDSLTGEPLANISVSLERAVEAPPVPPPKKDLKNSTPVYLVEAAGSYPLICNPEPIKTKADGSYEFVSVPPGEYGLFASGGDYLTRKAGLIVVHEGSAVYSQDIMLLKGLKVTGIIVSGDTGEPPPIRYPFTFCKLKEGMEEKEGSIPVHYSADDGSFTLSRLSPGGYRLKTVDWDLEDHAWNGYRGSLDFTLYDRDLSGLEWVIWRSR